MVLGAADRPSHSCTDAPQFSGPGHFKNQDEVLLRTILRLISNGLVSNDYRGRDSLCAARLVVPMSGKPTGSQPVALGDVIYRFVLKAIQSTGYTPNMLAPVYYGLQSPLAQPITHLV